MIAASLFSGIGAPEQAMPHWDWRWCAEIEKFACAVLQARHPHTVNLGDVSVDGFTERAAQIARPDVVVFGSPCQSFSVAGRRLGLDDPRGNLALVALGIVDRLKPRWFVFENVPGLMSSAGGSDFGIFLRTVDELGYRCAWSVLDAQHFGVAQRRERLFVVGHLGDWRYPAAVLLEPEGVRGNHPPRREKGQRVASPIAAGVDRSSGYRNDAGRLHNVVTHALTAEGFDASEDGTGRGPPLTVAFAENSRAEVRLEGGDGAVASSLKSGGGKPGQGYPAVVVALRGREGGATAELSELPSALRASQGGGDKAHVMTSAVRRLMPVECEKLQGFWPGYTAVTYRGKPAADGPRYRALGNSMAVPVVRWILERIEAVERE